jgi:dihydroorotate dehydrogenase electron transfer subunit
MTGRERQVFYPDRVWHGRVTVDENVTMARDTYRVRVTCPEIAERIVPGQFVMLRLAGTSDPLLGRPLALYDTVPGQGGSAAGLDIVYLAVGKLTRRLATLERGGSLEVWGPLGNGFPATPTEHLLMVAGGIGQTPFMALASEYLGLKRYGAPARCIPRAAGVTMLYGVKGAEYLAGVEDFRRLGVEVRISTEDGSAGFRGLVTALIGPAVAESPRGCRIVCCGPERMMEATAALSRQLGVPCQVSLESPMACGIGACFSCVAKVRGRGGEPWDYRRTCVEGPVFDAEEIEF